MGELATLKKSLEDETINHENQVAEMRHKHSSETSELNNQLDQLKRLRAQFEKQANQLQLKLQESEKICSDNADKVSKLVTELDLMSTALSEAEIKKGPAIKNTEALES